MAKMSRRTKFGIWTAVILLGVFFGLRRFEYSQVYHPTKNTFQWALPKDVLRQDMYFTNADGLKLNGWYFPAATNSPRKNLAILVCHGNGGNITYLQKLTKRLRETDANVLLFDYRGYGDSEGKPSEEGTYRDAQAAYGWLRQTGFAATNIFIYGESLGGGIASGLALREPAGGLILESTFTSTTDVGVERFPWLPVRLLSSIKYDTQKKLPQIHVPVLIMHSREDRLVPFKLAETNLATANEPKMFFEVTGGHAAAQEGCHAGMEKFLAAIEAARREGREVKF
jgi:pimeloyl-ACP methyl ester carboxylesterase